MSNHMIEWLSAEAERKGNAVLLTAYGPDGEEKTVVVAPQIIYSHYRQSVAAFMEENGDNSKNLLALFYLVNQ
jgi:hypothetical protein